LGRFKGRCKVDNIFGERLRKLRREKDVVLVDLAKHLDTTQSTLSKYENGQRIPNIDVLEKIAKYFNVSTDYLIGNVNSRKETTKYPDADKFIKEIREEVAKYGYDIKGKSNEDIAKMIVKALKLDEINNI